MTAFLLMLTLYFAWPFTIHRRLGHLWAWLGNASNGDPDSVDPYSHPVHGDVDEVVAWLISPIVLWLVALVMAIFQAAFYWHTFVHGLTVMFSIANVVFLCWLWLFPSATDRDYSWLRRYARPARSGGRLSGLVWIHDHLHLPRRIPRVKITFH